MACSCEKNYLGDHEIPKGHYLIMSFDTGAVSLYSKWGKVPHPIEYLRRWYDRRYDLEGTPNDPVPA